MSDKHLINSLPYIMGMVAAGTGVAIRTDPRALTASTNGKVVYFPPLPYKGEELAIYSLGYLIHEAGHIRSTDFTAKSPATDTPLGRMLINLLEDVRIERLINGVYPGARKWLDGLTLKFVETQRQGVTDPDADLTLIMVRYLQDWLYESVLGYSSVKGIGTKQRDLWRTKVKADMADDIEKLALGAAWALTTTQVVAAAGEIIAILQKEQQSSADQARQSSKGQQGEPDQQKGGDASDQLADSSDDDSFGDDANCNARSASDDDQAGQVDGSPTPAQTPSGDSDDSSDNPDANPASKNSDPSKDASGQKPASGQPPSAGAQKDGSPNKGAVQDTHSSASAADCSNQCDQQDQPADVDPQAYADALNALIQTDEIDQGADRGDVIKKDMAVAVGVSACAYESTFTLPTVVPTLKSGGDVKAVDRVKCASIALRYRMNEFLEASMKSRRRSADSGKRLVRDAGRRLAMGDVRLFEKRTEGQKIDTAVHVLLDISGSMLLENRYKVALDSALALGVAMQDVEGVSFSMSAFPFHANDVVDVVLPGELVRDVVARAALMVPNGCTPLDKGLLHAHTGLMTTKASRRVCLIVMDGEPDDLLAARQLIAMGEDDGIEYLGIGIGTSVSHITPTSCVVTDLGDLPKQVIAMMQNVILLPKAA